MRERSKNKMNPKTGCEMKETYFVDGKIRKIRIYKLTDLKLNGRIHG